MISSTTIILFEGGRSQKEAIEPLFELHRDLLGWERTMLAGVLKPP